MVDRFCTSSVAWRRSRTAPIAGPHRPGHPTPGHQPHPAGETHLMSHPAHDHARRRARGGKRLGLAAGVAAVALASPAAAFAGGSLTVTDDSSGTHTSAASADTIGSVAPGATLSGNFVKIRESLTG